MKEREQARQHLEAGLRSATDYDWEAARTGSSPGEGDEEAWEHPRLWDVPRSVLERWARRGQPASMDRQAVVVLGLDHWDEATQALLVECLGDEDPFADYRTKNVALCLALRQDERAVPILLRVLHEHFAASASGKEIGEAALGLALLGEFTWLDGFPRERERFHAESFRLVRLLCEACR